VRIGAGARVTVASFGPGEVIREIMAQTPAEARRAAAVYRRLVGYFAFDFIRYTEPSLKFSGSDAEGFRDVDLMLFDKVIAFDNLRQKIVLIVNVRADALETEYARAVMQLDEMARLVERGAPADIPAGRRTGEFAPLFSAEAYCEMVKKGKEHIKEGDVFQVVLSNRLEAPYEGSLLNMYRALRTLNPSPYMFFFSGDDVEVAGASPETLVRLTDGRLATYPLAGTRPRGATEAEDEALERELLTDPKELAEHDMLVDLGRNDIGRVSRFGSVRVEKYRAVERFSHVMHIGSEVTGRLKEGLTAIDAVEAVLPAGTLSGAPKIRACQIIDMLEGGKRGVYGGAIGYIDFSGNLDTCIAIRFAVKKNGKVFVRAGAGIVADSDPMTEHRECMNKARAVIKALEIAEGWKHDTAHR
jgi:anthranilate synthase component 1